MLSPRRGERELLVSVTVLLTCGALSCASLGQAAESKAEKAKTEKVETEPAKNTASTASDEGKKQEEAMNKAMEEAQQAYEKEKREMQERLSKDPQWQPSHEQVDVIKVNEEATGRTVHSFCLNTEGNLLVCCGRNRRTESGKNPKAGQAATKEDVEQGQILLFSPEGNKLGEWKSKTEPQAICVASDGTVYIGGAGKLHTLDKDGKVLLTADLPSVVELPPLPPLPEKTIEPKGKDDEAAQKAKQKDIVELQKKVQEAQKEFQKIAEEASKNLNPDDEAAMDSYQAKIKDRLEEFRAIQEKLMELQTPPEVRAIRIRMEREQKLTITGMAVSDRDVFLACRSAKGYGYAVWRTDRDFGNPKKIVENLAGCCGQMDIQAQGAELWVAHNARHKVEHYDRDGKKLSSFGKTDRTNADGFGGCCEPKNLRFAPNGDLLACESGPPTCVKRFTAAGKFLGVAVLAPWNSGCVRVTTEFDGEGKLFVLNSGAGTIYVFAKKQSKAAPTNSKTAKPDAK